MLFFMDRASSVGRQPCLSRRKRPAIHATDPLRCSRKGGQQVIYRYAPAFGIDWLVRLAKAWRCQTRGRAV